MAWTWSSGHGKKKTNLKDAKVWWIGLDVQGWSVMGREGNKGSFGKLDS